MTLQCSCLLGVIPGIATRTLLGAPGLTTRNENATRGDQKTFNVIKYGRAVPRPSGPESPKTLSGLVM